MNLGETHSVSNTVTPILNLQQKSSFTPRVLEYQHLRIEETQLPEDAGYVEGVGIRSGGL